MILLIDSGNTYTKYCLADDHEIGEIERLDSSSKFSIGDDVSHVSHCIFSSVKNNSSQIRQELLSREVPCIELTPRLELPFSTSYSSLESFGNDRRALISGAVATFPIRNCLIVSVGTCITYDLLDKEAHHHGGRIAPGMRMRFKALNNYTDKLPLLEPSKPIEFFGSSTKGSILSGVQMGMVSEINEAIRLARKELGSIKVLVTGGDAKFFENNLKYEIFADPKLLFKGLYKIYTLNAPS